MTIQTPPQGVNLLKELLFDRETRRLDELSRRLEADADAAKARDKTLGDKLDVVFERAGTEERLLQSVSVIIDGALREAEISRHEPLSKAIAPLIVATIKTQLRESQDEMVDALYPITGRLVKSYVQAEINKRMIEINARLGGGRPAQLSAESAATGVPVDDLALAAANKLEVEEIFLVRRGSGDLIAHWEKPQPGQAPGASSAGSNRDVLLSGYLSGIITLSEEAFGAEPGSFRTLTFANGDRIFVRGSAAHLLAVRCNGSAPAQIEQVVDEVFLDTLERYQKVLSADAARIRETGATAANDETMRKSVAAILPAVGQSIERQTSERAAKLVEQQAAARKAAAPSFARVYALAALLAAPFVLWGLWSAYQAFETVRTESAANSVLSTIEEIQALPPKLEVASGGRSLTLSGFVPSATIRDQILTRLQQSVPQATVRNQLGVLPQTSAEIEAALASWRRETDRRQQEATATAIARALVRVRQRLEPLRAAVTTLQQQRNATPQPALTELQRVLGTAIEQARSAQANTLPQAELEALWQSVTRVDTLLASVMGAAALPERPLAQRPQDPQQLAEECSLLAERVSAVGIGLPLPVNVAALTAKVERLRPPTPRDELDSYARANAIFFGNGTDFRDTNAATVVIEQLANRLRANPDVTLRVVGYTDERGTQTLNTGLAQTRADRVAGLLVERGVGASRIVAIGRLAAKDLSRHVGTGSANRRVEFELGFPGETDGTP